MFIRLDLVQGSATPNMHADYGTQNDFIRHLVKHFFKKMCNFKIIEKVTIDTKHIWLHLLCFN